jgi:hypothetical protein
VQVVGHDRGQVQPLAQPQQVVLHAALDRQAVVDQLEVEVVGPEDVAELPGGRTRLLEVADA